MTMWREVPSGREEAIETLVDMDPQGSFYRAARVLVRVCVCVCVCVCVGINQSICMVPT